MRLRHIINDIYQNILNRASPAQIKYTNYTIGLIMVTISVILGFFAKNVNTMLQWIVSGLWGGYIATNVLKWYWWRFNTQGYFGNAGKIAAALLFPYILPLFFPSIPTTSSFYISFHCSLWFR